MNCFYLALTGPPGIGKTTYVRKIISALNKREIPCYGFVTVEVCDKGRRIGFDIETIDGEKGILARINNSDHPSTERQLKAPKTVGQYIVDVDSFEKIALPSLHRDIPKNGVIIIDEIGKMEMFSASFIKRVRELIKAKQISMIVTIPIPKGRPLPLVEEIRNHKDFKVQTISKSNRDDESLFEELLKFCTKDL